MLSRYQGRAKHTVVRSSTACCRDLLQNNLNTSVTIFYDPWRSHCFCESSFSSVIITCTTPSQLRGTKPEVHSAPSRRACHVSSQFLFSVRDQITRFPLYFKAFHLAAQNKSCLSASHTESSPSSLFRSRSSLFQTSAKLTNAAFALEH